TANPITVANQGQHAADVVLTRLGDGVSQPFELTVIVGPAAALATASVTHPSVQATDWNRSGNIWTVETTTALTGNVTVSATGFTTAVVPVGQYENNRRVLNVTLELITIPVGYGRIHGQVTALDTGLGIVGATVTVGFPNGSSQTVVTTADGFYSINVPAGQYNVRANANRFYGNFSTANPITVTDQGQHTANVVLTRINDGDPQPYELMVIVGPEAALATASVTHPSVSAADWTRSGNMWVVETPAALTGNVTVSAANFATATVPVGQYVNNQRTLNVTLQSITIPAGYGRIHGQVTALDTGLGIAGATVTVGFPNGSSQTVITAADGFYSINVPAGQYNVRANADRFYGNFSTANPITVVDQGQHAANVVLTRINDGDPQPYELMVIVGPQAALATANVSHPSVQATDWTRSGNMWVVETPAALTGNVTVSADDFANAIVPVGSYVSNRRTLNVTLQSVIIPQGYGRIHGQVTALDTGLGIVGATVIVGFPDGSSQTVYTMADGFYSITVPVGQYNVMARATGFRYNFSTANPIAVVNQGQPVANVVLTRLGDGEPQPFDLMVIVGPEAALATASVTHPSVSATDWNRSGNMWVVETPTALTGNVTVSAANFATAVVPVGQYVNNHRTLNVTLQSVIIPPGYGRIHGQVTALDTGLGIAGATVTVGFPDGTSQIVVTTADGFYTINVPVGQYNVAARANGFRYNFSIANPIAVVDQGQHVADVVLTRLGDGEPQPYELMVIVGPQAALATASVTHPSVQSTDWTRNGNMWVAETPTALTGNVTVSAANFATAVVPVGQYVNNHRTLNVTLQSITIPPGYGRIHGQVTALDTGLGIVGATVTVGFPDGTSQIVDTIVGGFYSIIVPVGRYSVRANADGFYGNYATANPITVVDQGQHVADVVLTYLDGAPQPYELMVIVGPEAALATASVTHPSVQSTDWNRSGNMWVVETATALTGNVTVSATDFATAVVAVGQYVNNHRTLNVTLESITIPPGYGRIHGLIYEMVAGSQTPISGATVRVIDAHNNLHSAITGANGRYSMIVPVGTYTAVFATAPGGFRLAHYVNTPVAVADQAQYEANIELSRAGNFYTLIIAVTPPEAIAAPDFAITIGDQVISGYINRDNVWTIETSAAQSGMVTASAIGFESDSGLIVYDEYNVAFVALTLTSVDSMTVTFDAAGGTPATQTVTNVSHGATYAAAFAQITAPVRDGYVFQGWFTQATDGVEVIATSLVTATADHTLYAQWRSAGLGDIFGRVTAYVTNTHFGAEIRIGTQTRTQMRTEPRTEMRTEMRTGTGTETRTDYYGTEYEYTYTYEYVYEYVYEYDYTYEYAYTYEYEYEMPYAFSSPEIEPVAGATVVVVAADGTSRRTLTDADGNYRFDDLPVGEYAVIVRMIGYKTALSSPHMVVESQATEVNFHLEDDPYGDYAYMLVVGVVGGPVDRDDIDVTFNANTLYRQGQVWAHLGADALPGVAMATSAGFWTAMNTVAAEDYIDGIAIITLTLYRNIMVTFDSNGGLPDTNQVQMVRFGDTYADALAALTQPTRANHTFQGWWTAVVGGYEITATTEVTTATDHTLFARWQAAPPPPPPPGGTGGPWTPPPVVIPEPEIPLAEWDGANHAFMIGFADGTVRPRAEVTRAQIATMIFRLMPDEDRAGYWMQTNPFTDVISTNWHNNAVSTTVNAGIFVGMPDGTFMPDRGITRAELAATIVRYMGAAQVEWPVQFNDIAEHWAQGYINAAALSGWVIGDDGLGGAFRPNDTITRAEAAAIISRAFGRLPYSAEDLLPGMNTWLDNANPNAWYYLYIQGATNSYYYIMHEDGIHQIWVELIEQGRDWALLERPDSRPDDIMPLETGEYDQDDDDAQDDAAA
ncbi:MAG: carboxypeptidase regulatory-like domain-containing protein, partial [Oscillospiraceae bacterium]|nr:carboxypeptidase regulatory-like domain-containing protein [Oscillospiraceae bacterium]